MPRPLLNHDRKLTDAEYSALLQLYNEYPEAFRALPSYLVGAWYSRLYQGKHDGNSVE